jgi:hypothetical protein
MRTEHLALLEDEQSIFDANHLMIAGSLAHHWTKEAQAEWMAKQAETPWRINIGLHTERQFCMQIVSCHDLKSHADWSENYGSRISPKFPQVRPDALANLAREIRKDRSKPYRYV